MTAERSELIRKVANIVDFQPERFDMTWFQQDIGCDTTACIAGHVGELSNDRFDEKTSFLRWYHRQAANIGLDPWAAEYLFTDEKIMALKNGTISQILCKLSKEVETLDADEVLDENDVIRITDEVIVEKEEAAVAA